MSNELRLEIYEALKARRPEWEPIIANICGMALAIKCDVALHTEEEHSDYVNEARDFVDDIDGQSVRSVSELIEALEQAKERGLWPLEEE